MTALVFLHGLFGFFDGCDLARLWMDGWMDGSSWSHHDVFSQRSCAEGPRVCTPTVLFPFMDITIIIVVVVEW